MILVTGASGFIGAYLVCDLVNKGHSVRATRRAASNLDEFNYIASLQLEEISAIGKIEWVEADVLNFPQLVDVFQGVHEVYHCAAVVSFWQADLDKMLLTNIEGTANVVNAALQAGVKKLCHVSSISSLGRTIDGESIDEEHKWENSSLNSNYGISKHRAELEVWRGVQEGLNAVIVNPSVVIGPCNFNRGTGKLFEMAYKGLKFISPGSTAYVDVRDVAELMVQLMELNKFGQRYILNAENISYQKFFTKIFACFEKKPPTLIPPRWMSDFGAKLFQLWSMISGRPPFITTETVRSAYGHSYYNNTKVIAETGFHFRPLDQTISHTCQEYLRTLN